MVEVLHSIQIPRELTRRDRAEKVVTALYEKQASLHPLGREQLAVMLYKLEDPRITALIKEGKLTLGVIKPHVDAGKGLPSSDDEAAREITRKIGLNRVLFSLSIKLTHEQVEAFYSPNKNRFKKRKLKSGETLWHNLVNFATSGPLTFLLIYDEKGKAVEWWRSKMGRTRPSEARVGTVRGNHATDELLPNNLVHGSDSKDEALREFEVMKQIIFDLINQPLQKGKQ